MHKHEASAKEQFWNIFEVFCWHNSSSVFPLMARLLWEKVLAASTSPCAAHHRSKTTKLAAGERNFLWKLFSARWNFVLFHSLSFLLLFLLFRVRIFARRCVLILLTIQFMSHFAKLYTFFGFSCVRGFFHVPLPMTSPKSTRKCQACTLLAPASVWNELSTISMFFPCNAHWLRQAYCNNLNTDYDYFLDKNPKLFANDQLRS